ncbi:hypothetical protein LUZ61_002728 [Rhynchospora tenuis]|uniref:Secreted protein n=1 Tax=Rhynchospora tenuis TaxID=198213 RepID=A0AAD5ZJL4_9POAL|nr:hypothetical protein LUZ61_002728 [Rhynchospora tenuis]
MTLVSLFLRAAVRLAWSFAGRRDGAVTATATILYHGGALPRDQGLERLVCNDLLRNENFMLLFLINMMQCFT